MRLIGTEIMVVELVLATFFFVLASCAVIIMAGAGMVRRRRERAVARCREFLAGPSVNDMTVQEIARFIERRQIPFLRAYVEISSHVQFSDDARRKLESALLQARSDMHLIRELNRRSPFRRSRAALFLAYIPSTPGARALDHALRTERFSRVKIRIVFAIVRRRYLHSIPTILDSLSGASPEYQKQVTGLLMDLGSDLVQILPVLRDRKDPELQMVFVGVAEQVPSDTMRTYLETLVDQATQDVAREAFRVLLNYFSDTVDPTLYFKNKDTFFVNLAVEALGRFPSEESVEAVLPYLADAKIRKSAVAALMTMIGSVPRLMPFLVTHFRTTQNRGIQEGLAEVLSSRSEYLLNTARRERWPDAEHVLSMILQTHKATGVLAFLNRNTDQEQEREICQLIGATVREDPWLRKEFGLYGKPSVIRELGIEKQEIASQRGERLGENPSVRILATVVGMTVLLPPLIFTALRIFGGRVTDWRDLFPAYLIRFEELFIFYAVAINSVYLLLLLAAVWSILESTRLWETRPPELLFKPGILPSVSIIAPAYNEEATIVESVRALLNLNYPDYEVIVVNDGSRDGTLQRLVSTFELDRMSMPLHDHLKTQSVRGVYKNPRLPGLVVLDKSNGGKADSLNAGINASRNAYYAAIDADSLLEPQALLHLAVETLDSEIPVVATGGNVLPINGCLVERGHIDQIRMPRNWLASFQMVEYVRAFMTGRTGWARINSLLIISGAFGLFNTSKVIDVKGYLTSSERLLKDTVAEDMELVVRLSRELRDQGQECAIRYAPGANCWTEVPETVRILGSQRDRWQRGLIDVLFFHAAMALRRRFGRPGMIGMPYHYVFELVGPWIEIQGYLFLLLGLVLGVLPARLVVSVLVASVGLGMIVSLLSVQLAEWAHKMFRRRDRVQILLFAMLENFGYRQLASVFRLSGYISVLRQRTGWGTMKHGADSSKRRGRMSVTQSKTKIWLVPAITLFLVINGVLQVDAQAFRNIAAFSVENYFDDTFATRLENTFIAPLIEDRLQMQVKVSNQTDNILEDTRSLSMVHTGPIILFTPHLYGLAVYGAGFRDTGSIVHEIDLQLHYETAGYRIGAGTRGQWDRTKT
ncbi:Glycosyltransferase, catalytic subunit of cellulose synthase and poly-beta-1,6-N-acetylglucosamine synthase [Alkalispirochaeta americana]|uniref:Glycosyltransferase, catalytic subunit of cellulose synthase and poly-beta-1,6-N-acetylglucosamine synthase n=1 Tax=Alkalispirochaeta americana TaxID=159291 RepID=A0A1N6RFJ0_9SPIO|nr:glycosyltransferase [Alkalispirochaeta americana]SIQ27601.1 Glycosyltransferase, catalytic subunit of cellulose synthase and poly-beta-1,6-N-acetylglucosamine synthase [Alkalispirochaeta americana]